MKCFTPFSIIDFTSSFVDSFSNVSYIFPLDTLLSLIIFEALDFPIWRSVRYTAASFLVRPVPSKNSSYILLPTKWKVIFKYYYEYIPLNSQYKNGDDSKWMKNLRPWSSV